MRTSTLGPTIWMAAVLAATPALAVEGRYLGSVNRDQGTADSDVMRHLYEIGGRQPLPRGLDLRLRASLRYQSSLPVRNTDLLRSRLFGELRAAQWRVDAQLTPWQRNAVAARDSRERQSQFGVYWTPVRGPHFDGAYERLDRDISGQRSASENRRVRAAWNRSGYGAETSLRRIDTQPAGQGAPQRTEEWRGLAHAERAWRTVTTGGDYEGLVSKYRLRERRRTSRSQRIQGHATWAPHRKLSATATALERWGDVDDNALPFAQPLGERGVTGELSYRPVIGLNLRGLREYRRQEGLGGDIVNDYLQLEARYRHDIWRAITMQAGLTSAFQYAGANTAAPSNSFYGALDGRLRPGLYFRAEARASRVIAVNASGTQWQELAELRTRPTAATRVDVSWRRDTRPVLDGFGQTDHEWQVTGAFDPSAATSVSGTFRRLTGEGRLTRTERFMGMSASWRATRSAMFSANAQRRHSEGVTSLGDEQVWGFDVAYDLRSDTHLRGNVRDAQTSGLPSRRSYGVSVEKNF